MDAQKEIEGGICVTPLKAEQKESIIARMAFIETELLDLERFRTTDWKTFLNNRDMRRNIERIVENIANACIDIGKIILAGEATEMPSTYKEVIEKLGLMNLISMELAEELGDLVVIRNILAHQYLDLEWEKIKQFLAKGPERVKEFIQTVQKAASYSL